MQIVAKLVELADCLDAVAGIERGLHQRALCLLVGRVERDEPLPQAAGAQQVAVALLYLRAGSVEPFDEKIIGQKPAAIEVGRLFESAFVAASERRFRGRLEVFDIDVELRIGCERDDVVADLDEFMGAERAAREMDGFAQAPAGRFRVGVGPERLHHLLAVHAMRGLQRQQLDQRGGAVASPVAPRYRPAVDTDGEAAEQMDRNAH